MTFAFVMLIYSLQQHVLQFVCNSLQAFRFCSTAAPRVIPISQVPRHFGNSGYPCAVELIISISHVFSIFFLRFYIFVTFF